MPSLPAETTERFRAAMLSADVPALLAALAPGAVLRSPISPAARIEGHAEIGAVMAAVLADVSELEYLAEAGDGDQRVLHARAQVRGTLLEEAVWLRFDAGGLIDELTLFVRPLPGLTALTAALAPRLAARRGPVASTLVRLLTEPLALITRHGDAIALRLAGIRSGRDAQ